MQIDHYPRTSQSTKEMIVRLREAWVQQCLLPYLEAAASADGTKADGIPESANVSRLATLRSFWSDYLRKRFPSYGVRGWAIVKLPHTVQSVRTFLCSLARTGQCTTYETLERRFPREDGVGWGKRYRLLGRVLAVISTESWIEEQILLSSLVLNRPNGRPGEGFQAIAEELCARRQPVSPEEEIKEVFRRRKVSKG